MAEAISSTLYLPSFCHFRQWESYKLRKERTTEKNDFLKKEGAMVIIAFASYPRERAQDMEKRFIQLSPPPEFIKTEGPYMYPGGNGDIQAATLFKFDKSKMSEALQFANDQHAVFFGVVPGYTYDIKVCASAERARKVSGVT
jgi:hypothetical protein